MSRHNRYTCPFFFHLSMSLFVLSVSYILHANGRVTGVSGILGGTLKELKAPSTSVQDATTPRWRPLWLSGFFGGSLVMQRLDPSAFGHHINNAMAQLESIGEAGTPAQILAQATANTVVEFPVSYSFAVAGISGVLVGIGTRMGHGCTSGHGVCGLPRFSTRSLVAVSSFMSSG